MVKNPVLISLHVSGNRVVGISVNVFRDTVCAFVKDSSHGCPLREVGERFDDCPEAILEHHGNDNGHQDVLKKVTCANADLFLVDPPDHLSEVSGLKRVDIAGRVPVIELIYVDERM